MKCPNCNKEINDDAKYCNECGCEIIHQEENVENKNNEINEVEETNANLLENKIESNKQFDKKKIIGLIILAIVIVLIIVAIINSNKNSSDSEYDDTSTTQVQESSEEHTDSGVQYIGDRTVDYEEETNQFRVFFRLCDAQENEMDASGTAKIKITNDNGEVVFDKEIEFTPDDFTNWTNSYRDDNRYEACIYISKNDIDPGSIESGILSLSVVGDDYSFSSKDLTIYDNLPTKTSSIKLPDVPSTYKEYGYHDDVYKCKVEVENIDCVFDEPNDGEQTAKLTFTVKMLEGSSNTAQSSRIGYSLKDSDGMVVDSGTLYFSQLFDGETAKEEQNFYDLKVGEYYTLTLTDVKN